VGIIQVGDLTIEILPKADNRGQLNEEGVQQRWRNALMTMLKMSGLLKLYLGDVVLQSTFQGNLLDQFLYIFLEQTEHLLHQGLCPQYRTETAHSKSLKGRWLIDKDLQNAPPKRDTFYTEKRIQDVDHIWNQILKCTLQALVRIRLNKRHIRKSERLLLHMEAISTLEPDEINFKDLEYTPPYDKYKTCIELAKLILENYNPSLRSGDKPLIALLFNMNTLFELFIYQTLKQCIDSGPINGRLLKINRQVRKPFWQNNELRPDIVISDLDPVMVEGAPSAIVIDTKWKMLKSHKPSREDLHQIFVYNNQYDAGKGILLYPDSGITSRGFYHFEPSISNQMVAHGCQLYFADIFDQEGRPDPMFASRFLNAIVR
jgi:5-methylcytosine-specific restriction enzyme subunit McrC